MTEGLSDLFSGEFAFVVLMTLASLLAVWVPLYRAVRICFQARGATRCVAEPALERSLQRPDTGRAEPLSVLMLRVLRKSLRDHDGADYSSEFVLDATKQYVLNEYDAHYARVISMYANLLPPIGFIGTTSGMLILFLSMHLADASLELGALAVALTSSIFALIGFALLEGLKIRLYRRLLSALDAVVHIYRRTEKLKQDASADPPRS